MALSITGCATSVSPMAANMVTVSPGDSAEIVSSCDKIGSVTGHSSTVFGGAAGRPSAEANAREQAVALGADTLVITNQWDDFSGAHYNGVAYNCEGATKKQVVSTAKKARDSDADKYKNLRELRKLYEEGILTEVEYQDEKRRLLGAN